MKKTELFVMLIIAIITVGLTGCSPDYTQQGTVSSSQEVSAAYVEKIPSKLYFIPHESGKADFPIRYAALLKAYPNLKVVGLTEVADEDSHNRATGYFILTESK